MIGNIRVVTAVVAAVFAGSAFAAVTAEEAKQLGGATLTAFGAEKAGNKEGTIPAYNADGVKAPTGYDPKEPTRRPDPYASEKPLFSITAQNAAQHADKLDGMIEMFKKYPNFRMDIYPSHRDATFPKWVADNTIKNATVCKGSNNDLTLEGCYGGYAFPIPKNGAQLMWNHLTVFEAEAWSGASQSYVVANNGNVTQANGTKVWQQSPFYDKNRATPAPANSIYWQVRLDYNAPARQVGEKLVLIDFLDNINLGRRAYSYIPGQRRVKLAPDLNYDTPSPTGGGVMTMDDGKVFIGPIDRFDWKLLGKKEKYIMYNNFKLTEHTACTSNVSLTKSFLNPDCVRWELHRVWVVEGKVKPGFRHIYPKRVFYWDEDGYAAGMSDNYDAAGKLYRINTAISFPFYAGEGGSITFDSNIVYDLQTGNYLVNGSLMNAGTGWYVDKPRSQLYFSPEALAGEGIR